MLTHVDPADAHGQGISAAITHKSYHGPRQPAAARQRMSMITNQLKKATCPLGTAHAGVPYHVHKIL